MVYPYPQMSANRGQGREPIELFLGLIIGLWSGMASCAYGAMCGVDCWCGRRKASFPSVFVCTTAPLMEGLV